MPRRCVSTDLCTGESSGTRWQTERYCREYSSWNATRFGINIHQTFTKMKMSCRNKKCVLCIYFCRAAEGVWTRKKAVPHSPECSENWVEKSLSSDTYVTCIHRSKSCVTVSIFGRERRFEHVGHSEHH